MLSLFALKYPAQGVFQGIVNHRQFAVLEIQANPDGGIRINGRLLAKEICAW
jgi:hypothetical protein